jgi:hypothetical protein
MSRDSVSGVSPHTAGGEAAGLIGQETLLKANIEYRIMNVECRGNEFCLFKKE